jgi:hypothetical protein
MATKKSKVKRGTKTATAGPVRGKTNPSKPASKTRRKATGAKRASARKMAAAELNEVAASKSAKVFRQMESLLKEHGLVARLDTIRLSPTVASAEGECPPGMVKRVVCRRGPDGRIVCREECGPI